MIHNIEDISATVRKVVDEVAIAANLSEESEFIIRLAMSELLNNGLMYSGGYVRLIYRIRSNLLEFCVIDRGVGFTMKKYEQNVYSVGGRGIHLVKNMVKSLRYNKKGTMVYVSFVTEDRSENCKVS